MIETPILSKYLNGEFIQFFKNTIKICRNNNPVSLLIDAQVNDLDSTIPPLDKLYAQEKGSATTSTLQQLDARRDNALSGIIKVASGYGFHFDDAHTQAGNTVLRFIKKYGSKIQDQNYSLETESINSLISDFETNTTFSSAITFLNLTAWMAELKAANDDFTTHYLARTSEYAGKPSATMVDLRKATTEKYKILIAHITSRSTLTPSDAYTKLINELNSLTDQNNTTVNERGGNGGTTPPPQSPPNV